MRGWIVAACAVGIFVVAGTGTIVYVVARYGSYSVTNDAMAPVISIHDTLLVDRFAYRNSAPQRGDIAVFMPPVVANAPFFKRVIAVPGDRIAIQNGRLVRNGKQVVEPYLRGPTPYSLTIHDRALWIDGEQPLLNAIPPPDAWTAPDAVPKDCYVVLGDNRGNSEDSHAWGFLCPGHRGAEAFAQLVGRALR